MTDVDVSIDQGSAARARRGAAVRDRLLELRELAADVLADDTLADLDDALGRLGDARCNVAVLGEFKRGKSSLVNALVDRGVLPTGVLPVTAAITVLRYGEQVRLVARGTDGAEDEAPTAELADLVTESGNPGNRREVASVFLELPDALLARGIQIVDTPGIGSIHAHNTALTEGFLGKVDVALCVLAADQPLNAPERELIAAVASSGARLLFALNKIDRISGHERAETLGFVAAGLRGLVGREPELFALSAHTREGVPVLRDRLMALADSELDDVLQRSVGAIAASTATSAAHAARLQAAALRLPIDELHARAQRLEERLTELERAHEDARDLLARGVERALASEVNEPLTRLAKEQRPALEASLERAAAELGAINSRRLSGELDAWIDDHVHEAFDELVPRYAERIGEQLRELEVRHAARVAEILEGVRAAAQSGLRADLSAMPLTAGLDRPPAFSFKLADPEDSIAQFITAGRTLLPGPLGRRLVAHASSERLIAMTDRHAGRLRAALVDSVREAVRDYGNELEACVERACAAIRLAVARAEDSHHGQRDAAGDLLHELAARERRCTEIAAELSSTFTPA